MIRCGCSSIGVDFRWAIINEAVNVRRHDDLNFSLFLVIKCHPQIILYFATFWLDITILRTNKSDDTIYSFRIAMQNLEIINAPYNGALMTVYYCVRYAYIVGVNFEAFFLQIFGQFCSKDQRSLKTSVECAFQL